MVYWALHDDHIYLPFSPYLVDLLLIGSLSPGTLCQLYNSRILAAISSSDKLQNDITSVQIFAGSLFVRKPVIYYNILPYYLGIPIKVLRACPKKIQIFCITSHPHSTFCCGWEGVRLLVSPIASHGCALPRLFTKWGEHRFWQEFHSTGIIQNPLFHTYRPKLSHLSYLNPAVFPLQQLLTTCNWLEVQDTFVGFKQIMVSNRITRISYPDTDGDASRIPAHYSPLTDGTEYPN